MSKLLSYRPDIDGLRAISVIFVILFHADLLWIQGGFIGVDIFFVISGYLITRSIDKEMLGNVFSFKAFYFMQTCFGFKAGLLVLMCFLLFLDI